MPNWLTISPSTPLPWTRIAKLTTPRGQPPGGPRERMASAGAPGAQRGATARRDGTERRKFNRARAAGLIAPDRPTGTHSGGMVDELVARAAAIIANLPDDLGTG